MQFLNPSMNVIRVLVTLTVAGIAGIAWILGRWFEWRQVFRPDRPLDMDPGQLGVPYEDVTFVAEDSVQLHGWWIPASEEAGTLIYLHGAAGNMGTRVEELKALRRLGLNLFAFDYRGYGKSRGFPTEPGTYRDARAAFEVVRARYGDMDAPPVVAYGHSLGGAVAIQLARDKPVRGVIVEGTFSSITDIAVLRHPNLPVRRFGAIRYDSCSRVPGLTLPKLIAHSRDDETVPFALARKLFDAAAEPKQFIELRGAHSDSTQLHTPAYWRQVQAFVDRALAP
jgi:fermentation-respiration switch protein FrsA (DUF1100 family)